MSPSVTPAMVAAETVEKISRRLWVLMIVALVVCVVIGIVTVSGVPLDTTISYNRLSRSFDLPLFVLGLPPLVLALLVIKNRRPDATAVSRFEYGFLLIVVPLFLLLCVLGQVIFANSFFAAAS